MAMTSNHVRNPVSRADADPYSATGALGSILLGTAFLMPFLVLIMMLRQPGALEQGLIGALQDVNLAYFAELLGFAYSLTSFYFALAAWVMLLLVAGIFRRWGAAVAIMIVPSAAILAVVIDRMLSAFTVPSSAMVEQPLPADALSAFPSGQVVGAVLIYGLVFFLARGIHSPILRIPVQTISVVVILMAGVSQIWAGSLWPSEVFLAYLVGGLFLAPMILIARRVDSACGDLPLVSAASVPQVETRPHARALTSTVVFNDSTVLKIYRPGFVPRAIYWLAFQAEFPYMRNQAALRAAVERRNLIGQLTEYWYGANHVARAIGIDTIAGRSAITSEFIEGSEPKDREAARTFLGDLMARFEAAGLPTWQIDPRQPRALDNLIETDDGRYCVVDLESGLVAPLASIHAWKRAFRRGLVPMYDDLFFDVTRAYIERHEADMLSRKGETWVNRLYSAVDATERATQTWHDSEPRIWSRLLGRQRSNAGDSHARQHWSVEWFEQSVDNWRDEGLIAHHQATELKRKLRSPEFMSVMPHFGVHLGTGLLLRFPLGSIARASYTAFNLLLATWRLLTGRWQRAEWRAAAGIHSPLVFVLAAIPGFGAFAYLASRPIRSDYLLLRVGIDAMMLKLPFRIYERLRLRWLVTDLPVVAEGILKAGGRGIRSMSGFGWSEEHRSGTDPKQQMWSSSMAEGMAVRTMV